MLHPVTPIFSHGRVLEMKTDIRYHEVPKKQRGAKERWWRKVDPAFPIHVEKKYEKISADEAGDGKARAGLSRLPRAPARRPSATS